MSPTLKLDTLHVDELVDRTLLGRVRVPKFQRRLRWKSENVIELFDSIYRGYPIGTLLLWQRAAPSGVQQLGPVRVDAQAESAAWWVVDGQQRLTSLVATLRHPAPDPTDRVDPYLVYFDLENPGFVGSRGSPTVPETWVPLHVVVNANEFQDWLFDWVGRSGRRDLVPVANDLGTRIRNAKVQLSIVETDDEQIVREIFHRTNESGQRMLSYEVFDGLVGDSTRSPGRLDDLADQLSETGFGRLSPNVLAQCASGIRSRDVTRRIDGQGGLRTYRELEGVVPEVDAAMRRTLDFLVEHAAIAHQRVLPYRRTPIIALCRFFHLFPDPSANATRILVRWIWRGLLSGAHRSSDQTAMRAAVRAVDETGTSDTAALALLEQVPKAPSVTFDGRFDARSSESRVALLCLSTLGPKEPETGAPIDVADSFQKLGNEAVTKLFRSGAGHATAANRFLAGGRSSVALRRVLTELAETCPDSRQLASHLVSGPAIAHLVGGEDEAFLAERHRLLRRLVDETGQRFAEWTHPSRRSLAEVLAS